MGVRRTISAAVAPDGPTSATVDESTIDVLLDTLRRFWPGSAPRIQRGPRTSSAELTFLAVPNARSARALVPTERRAAGRSMQRYSVALTARERAGRVAVASALRTGAGRLLLDRVELRNARYEGSLQQHLTTVLGRRVCFSVGVGSARANRKPVLQVFDDVGRNVAFVKVGDGPTSRGLVLAEAEALRTLGSRSWRSMQAPTLLHVGDWNGAVVLVMSPLATTALGQRPAVPVEAMDELAAAFQQSRAALGESDWWRGLSLGIDALARGAERDELRTLAHRMIELVGDVQVELVAWHGDWTPWNMCWRRGIAMVWDWERFEVGVPLGFDHIHYVVNARLRSGASSAAGLATAVESAVRGPAARAVGAAYLAAIALRYLQLRQGPDGELIKQRSDETLEAMRLWLS